LPKRKPRGLNQSPVVEAGPDITSDQLTVTLAGSVSDDAKPAGSRLITRWDLLEGPGPVIFADQGQARCRAEFSAPGDYLLRLVGDDGELWMSDLVTAHVLPRCLTLARAWEFNQPLDKEGWTEADLGTRERAETPIRGQAGTSLPVKYVAGGYYIVALEIAASAKLISADNLNVRINPQQTIRVRCQNHTTASHMAIRWTTTTDGTWDDAKTKTFVVTPNDNVSRDYVIDRLPVSGWNGTLKQLRLDLTTGQAATGTIRLDCIRIENAGMAAGLQSN